MSISKIYTKKVLKEIQDHLEAMEKKEIEERITNLTLQQRTLVTQLVSLTSFLDSEGLDLKSDRGVEVALLYFLGDLEAAKQFFNSVVEVSDLNKVIKERT